MTCDIFRVVLPHKALVFEIWINTAQKKIFSGIIILWQAARDCFLYVIGRFMLCISVEPLNWTVMLLLRVHGSISVRCWWRQTAQPGPATATHKLNCLPSLRLASVSKLSSKHDRDICARRRIGSIVSRLQVHCFACLNNAWTKGQQTETGTKFQGERNRKAPAAKAMAMNKRATSVCSPSPPSSPLTHMESHR